MNVRTEIQDTPDVMTGDRTAKFLYNESQSGVVVVQGFRLVSGKTFAENRFVWHKPRLAWHINGEGDIEHARAMQRLLDMAIHRARRWDRDTGTTHPCSRRPKGPGLWDRLTKKIKHG